MSGFLKADKKMYRSLLGTNATINSELKRKASLERWLRAHSSEKEYWLDYTTESLREESRDRYPKKAKILLKEWSKFLKINKSTKFLQIGCGPEDIINYIDIGETYSIDPLGDFYRKEFDFDYNKSNLIQASGEHLPFKDKSFDVVIIINVLDHTHLPDKVLEESHRVLKDEGILHLEVYIYQKRFLQLSKIWGFIKEFFTKEVFNIHHPYMFTISDVKNLISKKFNIAYEEVGRDIGLYENLSELSKQLKNDRKLTRKIPAMWGLLGFINFTCICKK